jgi:cytochrome c oxidase subunit 2
MRNLKIALAGLMACFASAAQAQEKMVGIAYDKQLNLMAPASPVMEKLVNLHHGLLIVITVISLLVLALLVWVCVRYNEKRNPVPSKTSHNTLVEIIWTTVPVLILVAIFIPSLDLHYYMSDYTRSGKEEGKPVPEEEVMTLKVIGYQWYWGYEYPDHGGITFESYMKKDEDLLPGEPRLLATDNHVVIPVDTTVRVQMTASDVIHAWAVPSLGVKKDAVPGRLNETWFRATKEGIFYGQCSELCGVGHAFMPITVEVVSKEAFAEWVEGKKEAMAAQNKLASR